MLEEATHVVLPGSVHTEVIVKVEHVGTLGLVVNLPPPLTLLLRYQLPDILGNELVLSGLLSQEAAPSSDVTGSHQEFLAEIVLYHDVPAGTALRVPVDGSVEAAGAEVWVTLSVSQETGAGLGGALALTLAAWEPVMTVQGTETELLTEVCRLSAGAALLVTGQPGVVTRRVRLPVLSLSVLTVSLVQRPLSSLRVLLLVGFGLYSVLLNGGFLEASRTAQLLLTELVNLPAVLGHQDLGDGTPVVGKAFHQHPVKKLLLIN